MQVTVNGEVRTLSKPCTLAEALREWGYHQEMPIAVAVNYQVIAKQKHAQFILEIGQVIDILMPMQGG